MTGKLRRPRGNLNASINPNCDTVYSAINHRGGRRRAAEKSLIRALGIYRILGRGRAQSGKAAQAARERETSMALSASEPMASESMVPESVAAIDRRHLARMTLGDRSLEQEVLQLFDRQASLLVERMRKIDRAGDGAAIGALAHT
ncbi:MAG TPA: hypothetical protein VGC36_02500 [Rhizomicrobium sp.]